MPTPDQQIFQTIEHLHSECSRMDKVARLAYLRGQWNRLNQMACQYAMYLQGRARITQTERDSAQRLIEMIKSVEAEGVKVENDLRNDALKELMKAIMS